MTRVRPLGVVVSVLLVAAAGCLDPFAAAASLEGPGIFTRPDSIRWGTRAGRKPTAPDTSEPAYAAGPGITLVIQDNMDRYTDAVSMGAYPYQYTGAMLSPHPSPRATSQPVNVAHVRVITPGRGESGNALRMAFSGLYQEGHAFDVINTPAQPDNETVYIQYYARITPSTNWPLSRPLAVKWLEAWHNRAHNTRIQWNTRYPSTASAPRQTAKTVWQVIDQGESPTNGDQPVGPYFHQIANGEWHRFTHAFRPHESASVKNGFSKMWIDGILVIHIAQTTVGVTPPGGRSVWCSQADVNNLAVADGVRFLKFGGTQTTVTGPWTYDIDDLVWWRQ